MTEFQKWLRDQIENAGGKVRPFAARIGVSHSAVSDMLNKDVRPSLDTVQEARCRQWAAQNGYQVT